MFEKVIGAVIEGDYRTARRQISSVQAVNRIAQLQNLIPTTRKQFQTLLEPCWMNIGGGAPQVLLFDGNAVKTKYQEPLVPPAAVARPVKRTAPFE